MDSWSKEITFEVLCDVFEAVSKQSDKPKKMLMLKDFLGKCRSELEKASNDVEDSLFPVMRLFLPQLDRERGSYGIKETLLSQLFIDMLKIGADSVDAKRLKDYKAPKSASNATFNDFASVLFEVLKCRGYNKTRITLFEVNENLDKIVLLNAQKEGVNEILFDMFQKMNAMMFKWMVRIILKDVKIGLGQKKVFNCFHDNANDLYDTNVNFRKVCQTLKDPKKQLNETESTLNNQSEKSEKSKTKLKRSAADAIFDETKKSTKFVENPEKIGQAPLVGTERKELLICHLCDFNCREKIKFNFHMAHHKLENAENSDDDVNKGQLISEKNLRFQILPKKLMKYFTDFFPSL